MRIGELIFRCLFAYGTLRPLAQPDDFGFAICPPRRSSQHLTPSPCGNPPPLRVRFVVGRIATRAPAYRSKNSGALRQDWPRIPLPNSKELLLASAELGRQIAALLDTEKPFSVAAPRPAGAPITPVGTSALQLIAVPSGVGGGALRDHELAVTVGWGHAGKGGVCMPGKGRMVERDYTPIEREAVAAIYDRRTSDGERSSPLQLLGPRTCDVFLNDVDYWSNIPIRVWEYTIGGYQVIKKWLSYREEKLLARPLTKDEVRYVQEIACRIAAILLLEPALNANYRNVKEHAYTWTG